MFYRQLFSWLWQQYEQKQRMNYTQCENGWATCSLRWTCWARAGHMWDVKLFSGSSGAQRWKQHSRAANERLYENMLSPRSTGLCKIRNDWPKCKQRSTTFSVFSVKNVFSSPALLVFLKTKNSWSSFLQQHILNSSLVLFVQKPFKVVLSVLNDYWWVFSWNGAATLCFL